MRVSSRHHPVQNLTLTAAAATEHRPHPVCNKNRCRRLQLNTANGPPTITHRRVCEPKQQQHMVHICNCRVSEFAAARLHGLHHPAPVCPVYGVHTHVIPYQHALPYLL